MVKASHLRPPTELPSEVLRQLDPRLAELYSQLPTALASRISSLVRQARGQGIHPNLVLKFAYLFARAEQSGDSISREHTRRSKLELAGQIHGLATGYGDEAEAEAKQRYRRGRRARQQIKASVEAVLKKWQPCVQVIEKHRSELPVHVQSRFSGAILRVVGKALHDMAIGTVLDEENLSCDEGHERQPSPITQTYIWWSLKMPRYRGKWSHMHKLAFIWRMSPTGSVKGFRTVVNRICKLAMCTKIFASAWESILSEM